MSGSDDFYEDDEPLGVVRAAFEAGAEGPTRPSPARTEQLWADRDVRVVLAPRGRTAYWDTPDESSVALAPHPTTELAA